MCLGIPMQVLQMQENRALCTNDNKETWVDMSLVGEQPPGSWVLVFLGSAREVLDEGRAEQITRALTAVAEVMSGKGKNIDDLFADLIEREPQLPEHLQNNT